MKSINLILLSLAFFANCSPATENSFPALGVRNAHAMAYHDQEERIYLFGGANEKKVLSDLWFFEQGKWQQAEVKHEPAPRTFPGLVYDKKNQRLILFGGSKVLFGEKTSADNLLNDTWEFKNGNWTLIPTSNAPLPRAELVMSYDEKRDRILLFGGYKIQDKEYIKLGDTWEFYDNNWHNISNAGPSPRHGVSMAYDPTKAAIVLFGGSTVDKQYGANSGETWLWRDSTWIKAQITPPNGVFNAPMIFEKNTQSLMRFGGWNGTERINETWILKNNNWEKAPVSNAPSPRNHSSMVFDPNLQKTILYGGHDGQLIFGDTWEFSNQQWTKINSLPAKKRINNKH